MNYSNETGFNAQIANAKAASVAGDKDAAFEFLSRALDCSDRSAADLAMVDAAYAEIKA